MHTSPEHVPLDEAPIVYNLDTSSENSSAIDFDVERYRKGLSMSEAPLCVSCAPLWPEQITPNPRHEL